MGKDDWLSKLNKRLTVVAIIAIVFAINSFNDSDEPTPQSSNVVSQDSESIVAVDDTIEPFIMVEDIVGKSQYEVNKVLGKPIKQEKFDFELGPNFIEMPVTFNYYLEMLEGEMGRVEIMFVDGGAQRIQINLVGDEYYKDEERNENLPYAGLPVIDLYPPVTNIQSAHYKEDAFGFHRVTAADWLGTKNGNVEIITKEKYE